MSSNLVDLDIPATVIDVLAASQKRVKQEWIQILERAMPFASHPFKGGFDSYSDVLGMPMSNYFGHAFDRMKLMCRNPRLALAQASHKSFVIDTYIQTKLVAYMLKNGPQLPSDITVYRGTGLSDDNDIRFFINTYVSGRSVVFREMMSTTPSIHVARSFTTKYKSNVKLHVVYILSLPKSTNVWTRHLGIKHGSSEQEILLPTCTSWLVDSVAYENRNTVRVYMHLRQVGSLFESAQTTNEALMECVYGVLMNMYFETHSDDPRKPQFDDLIENELLEFIQRRVRPCSNFKTPGYQGTAPSPLLQHIEHETTYLQRVQPQAVTAVASVDGEIENKASIVQSPVPVPLPSPPPTPPPLTIITGDTGVLTHAGNLVQSIGNFLGFGSPTPIAPPVVPPSPQQHLQLYSPQRLSPHLPSPQHLSPLSPQQQLAPQHLSPQRPSLPQTSYHHSLQSLQPSSNYYYVPPVVSFWKSPDFRFAYTPTDDCDNEWLYNKPVRRRQRRRRTKKSKSSSKASKRRKWTSRRKCVHYR